MIKSLNSKRVRSSWQLLFSFGILFMFGITFLGGVEILLRQGKEYRYKEKGISKNELREHLVFLKFRQGITPKEKQEILRAFMTLKKISIEEGPYDLSVENENDKEKLSGRYEVLFKVSALAIDNNATSKSSGDLKNISVHNVFETFFKPYLDPDNGILVFEYNPL